MPIRTVYLMVVIRLLYIHKAKNRIFFEAYENKNAW